MTTVSCATLDDNILAVFYEKGCHQCGEHETGYLCGNECTHEEEEQDWNDCYHTYDVKNQFCRSCFVKFEQCGCGCNRRVCEECAENMDQCRHCFSPLCSEYSKCKKCVKK